MAISTGPMGTLLPLGFTDNDLSDIDTYVDSFYQALCRLSEPMGGLISIWDTIERRGEYLVREMLSQSDLDLYNSSDDFRRDVHYSMVGFINKLGDRAEEIQSGCFTLYLFLPEYLMVANPERATQLARMPYEWYLQSSEWNTKRDAVGMRDGHRCARCGNQHVEIHIHHKTYERRGNERLSDLVTLCANCHAHEHEIGAN